MSRGLQARGIQSIEVGNRILMVLMTAGAPMMLRDLASASDLTAAQTHAYLASFRRLELVEQDKGSGRYILGAAALRLGLARIRNTEPLAAADKAAMSLSRSMGHMICVVVWGAAAPTAIQVYQGPQNLGINLRPGTTYSVTASADGRLFGAFNRSPAVRDRIESEFAGRTAPEVGGRASRGEFEAELAVIRANGYSSLDNSPLHGMKSVSVPVLGPEGHIELALTAVGKSQELDASPAGDLVRALTNTAARLATKIAPTR